MNCLLQIVNLTIIEQVLEVPCFLTTRCKYLDQILLAIMQNTSAVVYI